MTAPLLWKRPPQGWDPPSGSDDVSMDWGALEALEPPVEQLWSSRALGAFWRGPRIAIVGSRRPSPYGLAQARRFAGALAEAGWSVWSGLARGIDAAAHHAALEQGGRTVALLGSGLDVPWPATTLADRVREEGALMSEFPLGTRPRRHHFPLRNRVLAAMTSATLVIEAAWRSGSLITAQWAADLGREVFVVPGRIDHPMGLGPLRLLRDGATPVASPGDLLAQLSHPGSANGASPDSLIVQALRGDAAGIGELVQRTCLPPEQLLASLGRLALSEQVVALPGGRWRLRRPGDAPAESVET